MRAFEITPLMQEITDLVESGQLGPELEAKVALLTSEGPTALNDWIYSIKELEGQARTIQERIATLQERKKRKSESALRMREILQDVVAGVFNGKVKTGEFTASVKPSPKLRISLKEGRRFDELPSAFYKSELCLQAIKDAAKEGLTSDALEYIETTEPTLSIRG